MTCVFEILTQRLNLFKPQAKALFALLNALMCFNGRATMRNLSRYGAGSARRLRRWATEGFKFYQLNEVLLDDHQVISFDQQDDERPRQAIAIDATFLRKSGTETEGLSWYHNGSSRAVNKLERGLEMSLISILNLDEKSAYALEVQQRPGESALQIAIDEFRQSGEYYLGISKHVVADGYYARECFVSALQESQLELVTLLRKDAALRYLYQGEYAGRGRPKVYGERVDYSDLSRWSCDDELLEGKRVYSEVVNDKSWGRELLVVIIVDHAGRRRILYSTDLSLSAEEVIEIDQQRFQIEFLFRDAKQHTGLGHAQVLDSKGQEYFANASLTALNILRLEERERALSESVSLTQLVSSIRSLKTLKYNQFLLKIFISKLGNLRVAQNVETAYLEASQLGMVAA